MAVDIASDLVEIKCEAPSGIAAARSAARRRSDRGLSDATAATLVAMEKDFDYSPEAIAVNTAGRVNESLSAAVEALRGSPPGGAVQPRGSGLVDLSTTTARSRKPFWNSRVPYSAQPGRVGRLGPGRPSARRDRRRLLHLEIELKPVDDVPMTSAVGLACGEGWKPISEARTSAHPE